MKIPNRVLLPSLSAGIVFNLFIFFVSFQKGWDPITSHQQVRLSWLGMNGILLSVIMAGGLVLGQTIITSRTNLKRQAAYRQILSDFRALQAQGTLSLGALVVSPAYGIPLEWSNPLVLDFPEVQYLSMGWLTFSPPYNLVLENNRVKSLPDGFYQEENIYLMASPSRLDGICQFILEHDGVEVNASVIYAMPEVTGEPAYDGVRLYRLEVKD